MRRIVCHTKFKLDPFADGGSKRSVQLREILTNHGLEFEDDSFNKDENVPKVQLLQRAFRAMGFIGKHYPKKISSIAEYIRLIKYYALRMPAVYDKYKHQDVVFFWENTSDRDGLYLMKATGNPVIGVPHNVESLVSKGSYKVLGDEIDNLKACDAVFAISTEETWLLRLFGVNAQYLPYYPPKEAVDYYLSIRQKREKRNLGERRNYLLLGSATNPPTKEGMQSMIDFFGKARLPFDLSVAGYETENLTNPNNSFIRFYGTVSTTQLEQILCEVDAVLIYQPPTTGALTRIPEMRIAGVPVFVNFDASRNYFNIEDVRLYDTFDDLLGQLLSFETCQTSHFTMDDQTVRRFVEIVKGFVYE